MAYPALRTTKEDVNVVFSFLRRQLLIHIRSSRKHSSAKSCCARRRMSLYATNRFRESSAVLLLLEKTRIRNVRRTSKHFPTTKVDFLTTKVVLAIMRTITLFRNATDHLRSESEGLAYEYRPYMQFPVSGGWEWWACVKGRVGRGLGGCWERYKGGGATRAGQVKLESAISRKRLKITLSIWYSIPTKSTTRYRLEVVWKL